MTFTPFKKGESGGAAPFQVTKPEHVKAAVAAVAKLKDEDKPAAQKKVVAMARKVGGMQHVPASWTPKPSSAADDSDDDDDDD